MSEIDNLTQESLFLVLKTSNLTLKIIVESLQVLLKNISHKNNLFQSEKVGKQRIKDLVGKYPQGEIQIFELSLVNQDLKKLQKDLRRYGVDFSIHRTGENQYELFFSGKDRSLIENALSKVVKDYIFLHSNTQVEREGASIAQKKSYSIKELARAKIPAEDQKENKTLRKEAALKAHSY